MSAIAGRVSKCAVAVYAVAGWVAVAAVSLDASHGRPMSLEERTHAADKVVIAKARTVSAGWRTNTFGDRLIVSRVVLDVEESLKGAAQPSLFVDIDGGTIDGISLRVSGVPQIRQGDRGVFFLDEAAPAVYRPHFGGDGILILNGQDAVSGTTQRLDDVRRAVRVAGK